MGINTGMKLNEYQDRVARAWVKDDEARAYLSVEYCALALAGEAGEIANKVKKNCRAHGAMFQNPISPSLRASLVEELGDALWYIQEFATQLGVSLEYVATVNLEKLEDRGRRGVSHQTQEPAPIYIGFPAFHRDHQG